MAREGEPRDYHALVRRVPVTTAIAVTGGTGLVAAPEVMHLLSGVHLSAVPAEAALGLAGGLVAAAFVEAGFAARDSPNRYTAAGMVSAGIAGIAAGDVIHALDPAAPLVGLMGGLGGGAAVMAFFAAGAGATSSPGEGDHANQARIQSYVAKVPVVVAGVGLVGSALAAGVTAMHGQVPDLGLIHGIAAAGVGAAAGPVVAARFHRRRAAAKPAIGG